MTARISIALATYNGARYLPEQLNSFLAQTYPPFELVVGDDGSTDETLGILEDFAAKAPFPVRIYRNPKNLGFADNFLQTAERCDGDWIAFSDQDDYWSPTKLERVSRAIDDHSSSELLLVAHRVEIADENLRPLRRSPNLRQWRFTQLRPRGSISGLSSLWGCFMICRADLVRDIDWRERTFNENAWRNLGCPKDRQVAHDRWISLLANALGSTLLLVDVLGLFRRHAGATTGEHAREGPAMALKMALNTGPETYRADERAALDAAAALRRIAATFEDDRGVKLCEGADDFERLSFVKGARARLQEVRGCARRLGIFGRVFVRRGYFGDPFASAGPKAMLKDLYFCLKS
jgi:glycosyltransferase involved in cell wall biosynthesis